MLVLEDSSDQAERDALMIRYGGDAEAARLRQRASLERFGARNQLFNAFVSPGTSLLAGPHVAVP